MVPSVFATVISFHLLIVLSLPQIGTTSGGEREQEDFMSMCGPSDLWKCFSRDQVSCCFPPFRAACLLSLHRRCIRFPSCCEPRLAELERRMGRFCSRQAPVVQRDGSSVARDRTAPVVQLEVQEAAVGSVCCGAAYIYARQILWELLQRHAVLLSSPVLSIQRFISGGSLRQRAAVRSGVKRQNEPAGDGRARADTVEPAHNGQRHT